MRRHADRQPVGFLRALRFGKRHHFLHRGVTASDHQLIFGIDIGQIDR